MSEELRSASVIACRSVWRSLLDELRERLRVLVERRMVADNDPSDRFRGVYVTGEQAWSYAGPEAGDETDRWRPSAGSLRSLTKVVAPFGLSEWELSALVVAAAPDLDPRIEPVFGYLHDDLTRRRASVGLTLEVLGADLRDATLRRALSPAGILLRAGLLVLEDLDRPALTRSLRVPDDVLDALLGGDAHPAEDPLLSRLVARHPTPGAVPPAGDRLTRALNQAVPLSYVLDAVGSPAPAYAAAAVEAAGGTPLVVDLEQLEALDAPELIDRLVRAARFRRMTVVAGPIDVLLPARQTELRSLADAPVPLVLHGRAHWDVAWSVRPPLLLRAPEDGYVDSSVPGFLISLDQACRAASMAELAAVADGTPVLDEHRRNAWKAVTAAGLERLARRVEPKATWDDLVVPDRTRSQLEEIVHRVQYKDLVFGEWGFDRGTGQATGTKAMFVGESGTGKTLAAEVVANALGVDLYTVNLATVVDKYIGETEKNLERLFDAAERTGCVLFLDEADALLGKRGEVNDAHDRYSNVEVAYLLMRLERFNGLALLATNMRANIDAAFMRRLDPIVDFAEPNEALRRRIWKRHLPNAVDVDVVLRESHLQAMHGISGGNIRNALLRAAFLAAAEGSRRISRSHVETALDAEYQKLGRLDRGLGASSIFQKSNRSVDPQRAAT